MIPPQELVDIIRRDLDAAILKATGDITQNRAPDMETYCMIFGKINGLREARRAIDDLVKRINDPQSGQISAQSGSNLQHLQVGQPRNNIGGNYF